MKRWNERKNKKGKSKKEKRITKNAFGTVYSRAVVFNLDAKTS
jgi:hypothetical protein